MSRAQPASDYVSRSNTGMKNRIINGGMDISQRGTSFAAAAGYTLDRWTAISAGITSVITVTQNSDVPPDNEFQSSFRATVTTADAAIAAGDVLIIDQHIEGYNIRDLIGRTFTFSFWVRSSKTGVHCVAFANATQDRCYISEYVVITANTWEKKTITIASGLPTAGTWNYTNGIGLMIRFCLAGGSTFQTTAGAWNTGNFTNTSNQVNCLDTIGNIFAITGVQLEAGAIATPFEHRLYGHELMLCQRYYEILPTVVLMFPWASATQSIRTFQGFVNKRAVPAITMGTKLVGTGTLDAPAVYTNGVIYGGTGGATDVVSYQNNTANAEL